MPGTVPAVSLKAPSVSLTGPSVLSISLRVLFLNCEIVESLVAVPGFPDFNCVGLRGASKSTCLGRT